MQRLPEHLNLLGLRGLYQSTSVPTCATLQEIFIKHVKVFELLYYAYQPTHF